MNLETIPGGQDPEPTGYVIGYARVSTEDQNLRLQYDALTKYGVPEQQIYSDQASGTDAARPGFLAAMKDLRAGDTLVVWKLDRLGRHCTGIELNPAHADMARSRVKGDCPLFVTLAAE